MTSSIWLVDNPNRTLQVGDRLAGPRSETYRWELLDLSGSPQGDLDGVTDGSVEWSNATTLRASGGLTYNGTDDIDWLHSLVRAWYRADFPDGTSAEWPLGTFIPAAPDADHDDGIVARDVQLQSLLQVLDESELSLTYGLAAGTVVTTEVRSLIAGAGSITAGRVAGTDSAETLRTPRVWEPGTTRLQAINELMEMVNYFSLDVDGLGTYRLNPYVTPGGRAEAWAFTDDQPIDLPQFRHSRDYYGVPNEVTLVAQGDGDAPSLTATAKNLNPNDPLSQNLPSKDGKVKGRGRPISRTEDAEATSLSVLQDKAARRLLELSAVTSVLEIEHAPIQLAPNDAVRYVNERAGIDLRGVVQKWSLSCEPGALMKTTIREVAA